MKQVSLEVIKINKKLNSDHIQFEKIEFIMILLIKKILLYSMPLLRGHCESE